MRKTDRKQVRLLNHHIGWTDEITGAEQFQFNEFSPIKRYSHYFPPIDKFMESDWLIVELATGKIKCWRYKVDFQTRGQIHDRYKVLFNMDLLVFLGVKQILRDLGLLRNAVVPIPSSLEW
jgi:hypothetical protein